MEFCWSLLIGLGRGVFRNASERLLFPTDLPAWTGTRVATVEPDVASRRLRSGGKSLKIGVRKHDAHRVVPRGGVIRDSGRGFPPGLPLGDRRQSGLGMSGSVPIPNQTPCSDTDATLPWSYTRIGDESWSLRHQVRGDLNPGTENPRKQTEREKPRSMLRPIEDPRRSHLASPAVLRGMARG